MLKLEYAFTKIIYRRTTFNSQRDRDADSKSFGNYIDSNLHAKEYSGHKHQMIERLELDRSCNDDDMSDTNIVNGFDDSVRHDQSVTEYQEVTHNTFATLDERKSRNIESFNQKAKPKVTKTLSSMKENIPSNRNGLKRKWGQKTIDHIPGESSFAMNQNHLHLHLNVTNNSDYHPGNKSDNDASEFNFSHKKGLKSSRIKKFSKDKIKLKKNNVQYTPLTINGILKDHGEVDAQPTRSRQRLKMKSNDLSAASLSNSSRINQPLASSALNHQKELNSTSVHQTFQKRSTSTNNLNIGAKKNLQSCRNSMRRSTSPLFEIKTYKQDAIKFLMRRLNMKFKSYFESIKQASNVANFEDIDEFQQRSHRSRCSKKSISEYGKLKSNHNELNISFDMEKNNSPKQYQDRVEKIRQSIQNFGNQNGTQMQRSQSNFDLGRKQDKRRPSHHNFIIQPNLENKHSTSRQSTKLNPPNSLRIVSLYIKILVVFISKTRVFRINFSFSKSNGQLSSKPELANAEK